MSGAGSRRLPSVRIRLDLAYDGTGFSGWAAQPGRRTVEGTLQDALTTVLRSSEPIRLTVAGRTDAGVHALGQVAHADVAEPALQACVGRSAVGPLEALRRRLAGILPADLAVGRVTAAPAGFDARFSATERRYVYRVADRVAVVNPLRRVDTLRVEDTVDVAAMDRAGATLLGLHDFAAYCRPRDGATTIRTLLACSARRADAGVVEVELRADAFCHSMVRAVVGALLVVGRGRAPVDWPVQVRRAGRRDSRVPVLPAHGLTLLEVVYPPDGELGRRAERARSRREAPTD